MTSLGVKLRHEMRGRVLFLTVSGVLPVDAARALQREANRLADESGAKALVADLTGTVLVMDTEQLNSLSGLDLKHLSRVPVAFIAPAGALYILQEHCMRQTCHGLLRVAFSDASRALAWAEKRRELVAPASAG